MGRTTVILALCAFLVSPVFAATRCVDVDATDTDDICCESSDGCATCDSGDPCNSLTIAAATGSADTFIVSGGVYREEVNLRITGDNSSTWTCATGEVCYLEGWKEIQEYTETTWQNNCPTNTDTDCWSIVYDGLDSSTGTTWSDGWLWIDGVSGTTRGFPALWVGCDVEDPTVTTNECTQDDTDLDEDWEFWIKGNGDGTTALMVPDGVDPNDRSIFVYDPFVLNGAATCLGGDDATDPCNDYDDCPGGRCINAAGDTPHGFDVIADDVTINGAWVIQGHYGNGISCFNCDRLAVQGTEAIPIISTMNGRQTCDVTGCSARCMVVQGDCAAADTDYSSDIDVDWVDCRYSGRGGMAVFNGAKDVTISNITVLQADLHPPFDTLGSCDVATEAQSSGVIYEDSTATKSLGCVQDLGGLNSIFRRLKCTDPYSFGYPRGSGLMLNLGTNSNGHRTTGHLTDSVYIDATQTGGTDASGNPIASFKGTHSGTIQNSTFIGGATQHYCLQAVEDGDDNPVGVCTFTNNICDGPFTTRTLLVGLNDTDTSAANIVYTNNLYGVDGTFGTTFHAQVRDDGICSGTCQYTTLGQWQAAYSQDLTSLNADPLLTNGVPSALSHAVGASTTASTFDILDEHIRPRGSGPDIGAYEIWPGNTGSSSRRP